MALSEIRGIEIATTKYAIDYIVSTPDIRGGRPRIDGHRITVADIALAYEGAHGEWSAERIAEEFDLIPGKVHAALSYYFDHRDEIDIQIAADEASGEDLIGEMDIPGVKDWVENRRDKREDAS